MKLTSVEIENYRGIESLALPLDPQMTVLFGSNGCGKTSVLTAIALALDPDSADPDRPVALDCRQGTSGEPTVALLGEWGDDPIRVQGVGALVAALMGEQRRWVYTNRPGSLVPPARALPGWVFYETDRSVLSGFTGREVGLNPDFRRWFDWLYTKEYEELRKQREEQDLDAKLEALWPVRKAICEMLPEFERPRVGMKDPPRLVVSRQESGVSRDYAFEQLSAGYQGVLGIAADIARRMVEMYPALDAGDGLNRHITVLIDEIELHLHPEWQQRILPDLMRTFPNVQFVVSTHSPQILSTVHPKHIVELAIEDGRIVAGPPCAPTYGAEAGNVLAAVMGVEERPDNKFRKLLREYTRLIEDDMGEGEEALAIRRKLDELSPYDYGLSRADMDIRRRKMLREMGRS